MCTKLTYDDNHYEFAFQINKIYSVIYYVSNKTEAIAICSEFSDEYGFDEHDQDVLVVFVDNQYINELRNALIAKNYKLKSFQIYGKEALVSFVPNKRKK